MRSSHVSLIRLDRFCTLENELSSFCLFRASNPSFLRSASLLSVHVSFATHRGTAAIKRMKRSSCMVWGILPFNFNHSPEPQTSETWFSLLCSFCCCENAIHLSYLLLRFVVQILPTYLCSPVFLPPARVGVLVFQPKVCIVSVLMSLLIDFISLVWYNFMHHGCPFASLVLLRCPRATLPLTP